MRLFLGMGGASMRVLLRSLFVLGLVWTDGSAFAATSSATAPFVPKSSPLNWAFEFKYSPVQFPRYEYSTGQTATLNGQGFSLALEFMPLPTHRYGKVGIGLGTGVFNVSKVTLNNGAIVEMKATPIEGYLSYRFDYVEGQWFVPYLKGGVSAAFVRESGVSGTRTGSTLDVAGGLEICLNGLDRRSAHIFDRELGVNGTYLVVEGILAQPTQPDLEVNLGRQEIRAGLRFEM